MDISQVWENGAMDPEARHDALLNIVAAVSLSHGRRVLESAKLAVDADGPNAGMPHHADYNNRCAAPIGQRYHGNLLQCAEALEKYGHKGTVASMKEMLGIE